MESIINFFLTQIGEIMPFFVVDEYENAIILRLGKYTDKVYKAGIYAKWPYADSVLKQYTITTTISMPAQSIMTADGKGVVCKATVKYNIEDVPKFLLTVYDQSDAISDTTQGIVAREVGKRPLLELTGDDIDNEITKKLRLVVKKWGVNVDNVTLTDKVECPSLRLFNEQQGNALI